MKNICVLIVINIALVYTQETGPPGRVKIYQISECAKPINNMNFKAKIVTNKDKTDSLSGSFEIKEDFDSKKALLSVNADKKVGADIEKDAYVIVDKEIYPLLQSFMKSIMDNFKNQISPKIASMDVIPAGKYKIEGFTAATNEINTPQVPYGDFDIEILLKNGEKELVCIRCEVSIYKPSLPKMG